MIEFTEPHEKTDEEGHEQDCPPGIPQRDEKPPCRHEGQDPEHVCDDGFNPASFGIDARFSSMHVLFLSKEPCYSIFSRERHCQGEGGDITGKPVDTFNEKR